MIDCLELSDLEAKMLTLLARRGWVKMSRLTREFKGCWDELYRLEDSFCFRENLWCKPHEPVYIRITVTGRTALENWAAKRQAKEK